MDSVSVKGNWNEAKVKLMQSFANLTDEDFLFKEGEEEELIGRLQRKLGKTKDELRKIISD
ncbi:MAG: CsbD family protein [Bacteroidetes bacterium]|nr:CsbD family protein [Bacteroidota bacterium]